MKTPRNLFIVAVLLLITTHTPCAAQIPGLTAAFNESGSLRCDWIESGALEVYVVAYDLTAISGYEFELTPSLLPSFFLGKVAYGIAPIDFGEQYEVRAGTGGCVGYPTMMGPSPDSWTLTRYDLGYFAGIGNDATFCVGPSPGSGAPAPQYAICDEDATKYSFYPIEFWPQYPPSCAVVNPTKSSEPPFDCLWIPAETPSWGALKAQFRE